MEKLEEYMVEKMVSKVVRYFNWMNLKQKKREVLDTY